MKRNWISLAVISTLTVSSLAFAHGEKGGHHGGAWFQNLDQNNDGKVTLAEAMAAKDKHFAAVDANKDGAITKDEAQAFAGQRMREHGEKRFAEKDKNNDGKLTRDEVPKMPPEVFQKIDANKDGALTKAEFEQAAAAHKGGKGARQFERMDENGDGKVTRAEAEAGVKKMFAAKDANHDGVLTKDEMGHGHGKRGGKHQDA